MRAIKIPNTKYVSPPKYQCLDYDSDCLTLEFDHLKCWIYQKERGYCPFVMGGMKYTNQERESI